jgi:integrase
MEAEPRPHLLHEARERVRRRRRDCAIVLLLARLGLRAGDVAQLRLSDIEWQTGSLRVMGKSRYEVRLPLPQDVGDAIAVYLEGRPSVRASDHEWFVYSKRPFAGPQAVLAYLSRNTHRVAISNSRLIAADQTSVTFKVKDYRVEGPGRYTTMTLGTHEFIRRFLLHVLPKGFHRIRRCGLLAGGTRCREHRASPRAFGSRREHNHRSRRQRCRR